MRVLKKNTHVDLATGRRADQLVGDGQTVETANGTSVGRSPRV